MIASIAGIVQAIRDQALIVQTGGIGYLVHVPQPLLEGQKAVRQGQQTKLWTHTYLRETEISLYGFTTLEELDLFQLLLSVSGIGPRIALAVISSFAPEILRGAIAQGDVAMLVKIPGIGRKTAERVLLDLKDKVGGANLVWEGPPVSDDDAEVLNALTALGYSLAEAQNALTSIPTDVSELDQKILSALRSLGGS